MMMKVISHVVTAILTQDCFQAPITGDLFGTKIEDYKLPMMTSVITITELMMTPRTRAMGNGQWAMGNVQCL